MTSSVVDRAIVGGGIAGLVLLLVGGQSDPGVIYPAVLPMTFLVAGAVALLLRPGQGVARMLASVGSLHLGAFGLSTAVELAAPGIEVRWLIESAAQVLYWLGFVALLAALVIFPDGHARTALDAMIVRGAAAVATALGIAAAFGAKELPVVLGSVGPYPNPFAIPAFEPAASIGGASPLLVPAGVLMLAARYHRSSSEARGRIRWPLGAAITVAVAILISPLLVELVGETIQGVAFTLVTALVPVSFVVGLVRHTEIEAHMAELAASRHRLAEAGEAERRRIERDIHDGAQQELLSILARIELARSRLPPGDPTIGELAGVAESVRRIHRELRELAQGIHPSVLTDRGLAEALASATARLPIAVHLEVAPAVAATRYPETVEATAYFFVLEALTNVMKHAGVSHATVDIDEEDGRLRLEIIDPGRGFEPAAAADGTGLVGMRDRLEAVGGELAIRSAPGRGTVLTGWVPGAGVAA